MKGKLYFGLLSFWLLGACTSNSTPIKESSNTDSLLNARHSYSNFDEITLDSLHLALSIDFRKHQLSGSASWAITSSEADTAVLDIRNMDVEKVQVDGADVKYVLTSEHPIFGQGLKIPIQKGSKNIEVFYSTREDAQALQWMSPEQTAGKQPFLFTQSQAILARTWVPCMDVPSNRFTYTASIQCDTPFRVLMSAENPEARDENGFFQFRMKERIPSYLLALAAGNLEYKAYDERCGVFAEPVVLDKAFAELKDLPAMIEAAESLYGEYRWGKYDVLFLPSSFPFGGMENPRITFATPTILAGDGSLVSLVAHELAHSWSGNLVTNRTWNDFWLNEGFTVYFEQRIMEKVYGKQYADMLEVLGYQDLKSTLEEMGPDDPDSKLFLDLDGRDPDDGVSDIAYEKGRFFLVHLEKLVGRERFDAFLKNYFNSNAFGTMTTKEFIAYLESHLLNENPEWKQQANIDAWVYQPGLPGEFQEPYSAEFDKVDSLRNRIMTGDLWAMQQTENWTTHHWLRFIRGIETPAGKASLAMMESKFHFSKANAEIADRWFIVAVKSDWRAMEPEIRRFLNEVGRRKFLTPLYSAMKEQNEFWKSTALSIYEEARPGYHAVSIGTMDALLKE